jgi:hypothetical protein
MSAPTVLDAGALVTGLAWSVNPSQTSADVPEEIYVGDEQRSLARLAQLTRTHNVLCTQAVDAFEIAAGLEAAGVSDRQARTLYGAASVFELAEAMYGLVPRRPSKASASVDPWQRPLSRHLLRGLLYGLPGLLYAVALTTLHTGHDALLLLGATIVASGLGQGLSLLGNILIGRRQTGAASALFRTTLFFGGLLGVLIVVVSWLTGFLSPAAVLAGFQFAYLLAATVLMVVEAGPLLLAVLAPGVLLAVVQLSGAVAIPRDVALGVLALCVAAAVVAAWSRLGETPIAIIKHLREGFGLARSDYAMGAGYLVHGLATAGLISFAVLDAISRRGDSTAGPIALMMLPLVASLGVAEWLVYRLRSRAITVLRETSSVAGFRVVARSELVRAVLGYGTVLTALTCAVIIMFPQHDTQLFALSTGAYGVLGLALFGATLLLSLGRHRLALGLSTAALVVNSALRAAFAPTSPEALVAIHLTVFVGLLVVVMLAVTSQYTTAGAHR